MIEYLKIRFHARKFLTTIVLLTVLGSNSACSPTYPSVADFNRTATALASPHSSAHVESVGFGTVQPSTSQGGGSDLPVVIVAPPADSLTSTPFVIATLAPTTSQVQQTPPEQTQQVASIIYYTQSGDTLPSIAARYNVLPLEISSQSEFSSTGLITPGILLIIPNRLGETGPGEMAIPDSEVIYSPSALDFDMEAYISQTSGYLSRYREYLLSGWHTGAQVIERVAIENSINPRLLLALIEYRSNWVFGSPVSQNQIDYPMGYINFHSRGLYRQLSWAVSQLSVGYYGWRAGLLTDLSLSSAHIIRLAPGLNAGTVALQNLFAQLEADPGMWQADLYGPESLPALFEEMFGNPWERAQTVEPLYHPSLEQPELELPFLANHTWAFTGGPHSAWGPDGALAALDFAPRSMEHGCVESIDWVTASAPGLVVRSENGVVILDLDGDGREQTGWALLYLHLATTDRVQVGTWVETNDRLGHPSCEGGVATGTHVHIARKFNGEWILADGPMPFDLSGWIAHNGSEPYEGSLTFQSEIVLANTVGSFETLVTRPAENP